MISIRTANNPFESKRQAADKRQKASKKTTDVTALRKGLGLQSENGMSTPNASDLLKQYMSQSPYSSENDAKLANSNLRNFSSATQSSYSGFVYKNRAVVDLQAQGLYSARTVSQKNQNLANFANFGSGEDFYATRLNMEVVDTSSLMYRANPVPEDLEFLKRR